MHSLSHSLNLIFTEEGNEEPNTLYRKDAVESNTVSVTFLV